MGYCDNGQECKIESIKSMTAQNHIRHLPAGKLPTDDVVSQLREQGEYDRVMLHITRQMVWDGIANSALFGDAVRAIAWQEKSAKFYLEVIQMALEVEAGLLARELAYQGLERYPDDPELSKAADLLSPPKFITTIPPKPSLSATMAWFRNNGKHYRGRWVAVRDGQLVGVDEDFQTLVNAIGDVSNDPETVITCIA